MPDANWDVCGCPPVHAQQQKCYFLWRRRSPNIVVFGILMILVKVPTAGLQICFSREKIFVPFTGPVELFALVFHET